VTFIVRSMLVDPPALEPSVSPSAADISISDNASYEVRSMPVFRLLSGSTWVFRPAGQGRHISPINVKFGTGS